MDTTTPVVLAACKKVVQLMSHIEHEDNEKGTEDDIKEKRSTMNEWGVLSRVGTREGNSNAIGNFKFVTYGHPRSR